MTSDQSFDLGEWRVEPRGGRLIGPEGYREVEPKVMDLLCLLASAPGRVFSRDEIGEAVWPGVTVNEDALSRCVWKLRRALGDPARAPRYVETVSKRGYRLKEVPVFAAADASTRESRLGHAGGLLLIAILLLAGLGLFAALRPGPEALPEEVRADQLVRRADDFYYQFEAGDNEAARRLYEQALQDDPDYAPALAGLANTIVQRVVRFAPGSAEDTEPRSRIAAALDSGRSATPEAQRRLARAEGLARRAVAADPSYALGWRALGLALSARGELDAAIEAYNRALTLDPDAWEAHINLSDVHAIHGEDALALTYLEQAFEAMSRVYDEQAVLIRPWYSETGLLIARAHAGRDDPARAELWYRRILYWDPYNPAATRELAALLREGGDEAGAAALCAELAARGGERCG